MDFVEVYPDAEGQYRWRKIAGNGEKVSQGEQHPRLSDAVAAARREYPDLQVRRLTEDTRD